MASGIDIAIENLRAELSRIRMDLSGKRKTGFDTRIVELMAMNIPSKIQLAEATQDLKDVQQAAQLLDALKKELDSAKLTDEPISLDTFLAAEKQSLMEKETMQQARVLIQEARSHISRNEYQEALFCYAKIRNLYKYIPKSMKALVYQKTMRIHKDALDGLKNK